MAHRLLESIAEPYMIGGQQISIGVSIGGTVVARDATADTILAEADLAMYQAKEAGRGTLRLLKQSSRLPNVDEHQMFEGRAREHCGGLTISRQVS